MALSEINATCDHCSARFSGTGKRTFLGFQKLRCPECSKDVVYPLTKGYRITYWVILAFMAFAFISAIAQGGIAIPGLIGIAVIIAIVRDFQLQRRVGKAI